MIRDFTRNMIHVVVILLWEPPNSGVKPFARGSNAIALPYNISL